MKTCPVSSAELPEVPASGTSTPSANDSQSFDNALNAATLEHSSPISEPQSVSGPCAAPFLAPPALPFAESLNAPPPTQSDVAAAYQSQVKPSVEPAPLSGFQKYKDDQLLRNPGGRYYYLDKKQVDEHPHKESPGHLLRKDISDAFGNMKNFFGNMFLGTTILYRNEQNEIVEGHQRGLLRTTGDFCKDLGSALSFGSYHPGSAEAPQGFKNRLLYSASKLKDAFMGDILEGIPSSVNHMGKNLILSGWHLLEVVPDAATCGFEPSQKLTTNIFDNGHVAIEYLTDVIPSGDAWLRVHASNLKELKLPVLYNLKMPEHYSGDTRWEHVRNTPYRKSIETIGALLADGLTIGLLGQSGCSSNRRHQIED